MSDEGEGRRANRSIESIKSLLESLVIVKAFIAREICREIIVKNYCLNSTSQHIGQHGVM